jgi:hypothetical protein
MRCPDRGKRLGRARREEAVCLHPPYRSHTQELVWSVLRTVSSAACVDPNGRLLARATAWARFGLGLAYILTTTAGFMVAGGLQALAAV